MGRVTLEAGLCTQLKNFAAELELCDEAGQTMGRFLPEAMYQKLLYALAMAQRPPLAPEEIERRKQEPGKPLHEMRLDWGFV
jgi:hypothetical protein